MHVHTKLGEHGGFDAAGAVGLFGVRRIDHLDVVRLVPRHNWSRVTPLSTACMMGHWGVVSRQRRWVSFSGSSTTSQVPRSQWSLPSMTNTRLQTTCPGLETPVTVPPPRRKYMGGWRWLVAPR